VRFDSDSELTRTTSGTAVAALELEYAVSSGSDGKTDTDNSLILREVAWWLRDKAACSRFGNHLKLPGRLRVEDEVARLQRLAEIMIENKRLDRRRRAQRHRCLDHRHEIGIGGADLPLDFRIYGLGCSGGNGTIVLELSDVQNR
jgi:hypothetical protein